MTTQPPGETSPAPGSLPAAPPDEQGGGRKPHGRTKPVRIRRRVLTLGTVIAGLGLAGAGFMYLFDKYDSHLDKRMRAAEERLETFGAGSEAAAKRLGESLRKDFDELSGSIRKLTQAVEANNLQLAAVRAQGAESRLAGLTLRARGDLEAASRRVDAACENARLRLIRRADGKSAMVLAYDDPEHSPNQPMVVEMSCIASVPSPCTAEQKASAVAVLYRVRLSLDDALRVVGTKIKDLSDYRVQAKDVLDLCSQKEQAMFLKDLDEVEGSLRSLAELAVGERADVQSVIVQNGRR